MRSTEFCTALAVSAALALGACAKPAPNPNEGPGAMMARRPANAPAQPGVTATPAGVQEIAGNRVVYANAGFEAPAQGRDEFEGWHTSQHAGVHSYDFDLDTAVKHGRKQSLRITSVGPEVYGAIYQILPAASLRGRTVEFSGWLRTTQATGDGAQLTLIARTGGAIMAHSFMEPGVTGSQEWALYTVRMVVPKNADRVEFGAMLVGPGTVWVDDTMLHTFN